MDTNWDPDRYTPATAAAAMRLSAGDVLYLPRGVMHQAQCTDRASMHLTISVTPLTVHDLIARELRRVADTNAAFRRRVPWSVDGGGNERDAIEQIARSCLRELTAQLDVAAIVQTERRSIRAHGDDLHASVDVTAVLSDLFEGFSHDAPAAPTRAAVPPAARG